MTSREGDPPQIYIPTLHRELLRRTMPETVLFLDPGLPQTADSSGSFVPSSYPFTREEAARALADLLEIGEALDVASPSGSQAARARLSGASALSAGEEAALGRFAASGSSHGSGSGAHNTGTENPLIAAQKVLLLAWDLEDRLIAINALRREVAGAAGPLAEALADPTLGLDARPSLPGGVVEALKNLPDSAEPDWRLTLAAMAAFLPENAVLVSGNAAMRAAMLESGMLMPLPEDAAENLAGWTEKAKASCLWAKAPLWRVIGRMREPENAPWLLASPEIVICSEGGAN